MSDTDNNTVETEKPLSERVPKTLPIVPVPEVSMFPKMQLPMVVTRPELVQLVDEAMSGDRFIGILTTRKKEEMERFGPEDLYEVGTASLITKMAKTPDGNAQMIIQGVSRFKVQEFLQGKPYPLAMVQTFSDEGADSKQIQALASNLMNLFAKMVQLSPFLPDELAEWARTIDEPGMLADVVASTMKAETEQKQHILELANIKERLQEVNQMAAHQLELLELEQKIHTQVKGDMDKTQRDYYLRQQLKAIQDELGEKDDNRVEVEEYRAKIEEKNLPELAKKEAERELTRLERMHPSSAEYSVALTYLDWMVNLPWNESSDDNLDVAAAKKVLDDDHFGLEKPKKRILEYLAVRKLKPDSRGPILCLAGPPGTGKTSLGRSIARALGREFVRISLGGVRDEAEIRGHRRTYVGALPGRIIQGIRRAETNNPIFMLDEIDKVGSDFRGDPSSALLEVLDPEQNDTFSDHYLDVPFDLSKVMFVTTANRLDTIPAPLRDRMEVIQLSGYTAEEKLQIARRYLIPRQREAHGLSSKQVRIADAAVKLIISGYTREAGLRNLEREIAGVCRGAARQIAEGSAKTVKVAAKNVPDYLGPERIPKEEAARKPKPGVVTGLAWTPVGGDILTIEALSMPGNKGLILTGQLGDVMKESVQAALSFVRSRADKLGIDPEYFSKHDVHIHVPAGAIPKDGPSAGVTMLTALTSLATNKKVKKGLAMTGEITLRGKVLPVGGVKEKVLAAHRAGIREIILPAWNEKDLDDIPENVKKSIKFHYLEDMDKVLKIALGL